MIAITNRFEMGAPLEEEEELEEELFDDELLDDEEDDEEEELVCSPPEEDCSPQPMTMSSTNKIAKMLLDLIDI